MKRHSDFRYKYKNIIITVIFTLIVAILLIFTMFNILNIRQSNQKVLEAKSISKIRDFESSLNLSKQVINSMRYSDLAKSWANTYSSAEETYYLIKLMELINKETSILTDGDCLIGVWKPGTENAEVILNGATISEEYFINNILGLDPKKASYFMNTLRMNGEYIVFYDDTSEHNYFIKLYYEKYNNGELVYFTMIPYDILNIDQTTWYIRYNQSLLSTNNYDDYLEHGQNLKADNLFNIVYFENSANGIEYIYKSTGINLYFVLLIFSILLCISLVILYLIFKILNIIYEPINILIDETKITKGNKHINEIKLFQESIIEVNLLNNRLESVKESISIQTNERKYFNLLMGYKENINYDIDKYCLSLIEFDTFSASDKVFYIVNDLQFYASKKEDIIFIKLDELHIIFIHKCDDYKIAEEDIKIILDYTSELDVKVALTDVYDNLDKITGVYEFAYKILNYKYHFPDKDVIIFSDIYSIKGDDYNFSISIENQLINLALKGDEKALEVFDKFMKENMKSQEISTINIENYILALINMINRIFSELKLSSTELIGYDISFVEWISMRNNPNIIFTIRKALEDIIFNIKDKKTSGDKDFTNKIINFIQNNYMKDIMLIDLSEEFGLSYQRINTLFKDELSTNFKSYLNSYRIEMAQKIQTENKDIKTTELSELVGFNSSTSFIRAYKKQVGISPQEFKKNL